MSKGTTSGRTELAAILDLAAQQDGAIRLLKPKAGTSSEPGLFSSSKGRNAVYQKELIGPMLEEVLARPKMVKLTDKGIEILVRNTPQAERPGLVTRSSDLYRRQILQVWKRIAIEREAPALEQAIAEHFGDILPTGASATGAENDVFKQDLARELALSWGETTNEETRKRLSYFLRMTGAEPFEKIDSIVTFSGLTHKPKGPLFKGDPALVLLPGWKLNLADETSIILQKAEVTATN